MRLSVPEQEDSERPAERWSDLIAVVRRRRPSDLAQTHKSVERKRLPEKDGRLATWGGPILAVVIALWLTAGVWGGRPPAGDDMLGHLIVAEYSIDHLLGEWQLDGWQPRFNIGYETFLFLGPGFFWAVGLVKLLSLGLPSAAAAFKVVVIASFVALPLAVAFLARSFGLSRREAGIAAILAIAVNNPFGGVGLQGLFGAGLAVQQFGAILLVLALGSILRLMSDPGARWTFLSASTLAALLVTHTASVAVLGVILLVLFAAVSAAPKAASAVGLLLRRRLRAGSGDMDLGAQEMAAARNPTQRPTRVLRHLFAAAALAFGMASFHLIPLLAHRELGSPPLRWPTPPLGERLGAILQGELLFRPPVLLAVIAGWAFALAGLRRHRPSLPALAVTPLVYLVAAHWAARQWPGDGTAAQLPGSGLGYAGLLAILPLAALLVRVSRRWGWRGDLGALGLAAALVVVPLGSAKDVARQMPDPIPQMHEAARQLKARVPTHARFATARDGSDETRVTGIPNPYHWLAWKSARNTLNDFGLELSPATEPPLEPEEVNDKPPDAFAETLSRLGVTHVVAVTDGSADRLAASPRLTEVWRSSPVTIFAIAARQGQPQPSDLVTFDAPGQARLVGAEPNLIAIQIEPSRGGRATLPISWSPKWHALLDGEPVDLLKAADGSMELDVPRGSSRLILAFSPDNWDRLGGAVTLATLVLLARRRRESRRLSAGFEAARDDVEELDEVPADSASPVIPSRAEHVTQTPLETVDVSSGRPGGVAPDQGVPEGGEVPREDVAFRAERVAQALLAALDASPRTEGGPARHNLEDGPGTPGGDREISS